MDPSITDPAAPGVRPTQPTLNDSFGQVDGYAEQLRMKLPLAPPGLTNAYMNVVPWVAIVVGILAILFLLLALVFSTVVGVLAVMSGAVGTGFSLVLNVLLGLVIGVLEVAGGIMMLQRRLTGWWLLAAGIVVSLLSSLLHVSAIGLIFWLLIAYVHLSVKPGYR